MYKHRKNDVNNKDQADRTGNVRRGSTVLASPSSVFLIFLFPSFSFAFWFHCFSTFVFHSFLNFIWKLKETFSFTNHTNVLTFVLDELNVRHKPDFRFSPLFDFDADVSRSSVISPDRRIPCAHAHRKGVGRCGCQSLHRSEQRNNAQVNTAELFHVP